MNIKITRDAIQYLASALHIPEDEAEEHLQMSFSMCQLSEVQRPDQSADDIIRPLAELAETKDHILYGILFRNAGVGFQWFDENRAGPNPAPNEQSRYNLFANRWTGRGLVVYGYKYSISEAIADEMKRFAEMEIKPS